jgi:glycosyltransferase involved in cell wall biosynthesis
MTLLSVVVPLYNEADGVSLFFERVTPIVDSITPDWEIVCVDDGSKDATLVALKGWHAKDPRIKIVSLSRNFGKEAALTAGLHHAKGRAVVPMDADLQDPPELLPEMVAKWREGFKVVLATRRSRGADSWIKRFSALLYYRLLSRMVSIEIPQNTGDFRLMDRQVVEVMKLLPERTRFMKGLFAWVGFSTTQIYFDREARAAGSTKQGFTRLWKLAKDGIFSFTTLPLQLVTWLGITISLFAFGYAAWLLIRTMIFGVDVPGYASIMAAVLSLGGIQLVCMGIFGEYLGRIYHEAKHRPVYVVEETDGVE